MIRLYFFIFLYFVPFSSLALEPTSGIVCKDLKNNNSVQFLFKKNNDNTFATAFKRIDGEFKEIGNVVGKKLSSFILFEDKTILANFDFAWHLDEVTKNLKPFLLSNKDNQLVKMPTELSCISKNFWY